jgi:hypothetical protein
VVALAGLTLLVDRAAAYEQPTYEVVAKDGAFELRRYEPYVVAETVVSGSSESAGNQAFRRLFRYISGKNRKQVRPDDPKIAMTVPVTMRYDADSTRMTFMVPGEYTLGTAPRPADPEVGLRAEPGGLVAAFTYSGRSSQERYLERQALLTDWAAAQGLEAAGDPLFAQYNGPFTPWFLRRNEVLLAVAESD